MMELLISWCVTSSILVAVFLLLRGTLFRKLSPRVRYSLWGVVLLRLLVPFQIPSLSLPASAADLAPELPVLSNRPLSPDTAMGHAVIPSGLLEENGLTIADDGTVQASQSGQDAALWELQENGEVYMYFGGPTLDDVLRAAVVMVWAAGAGGVLLAVLAANLRFAQKLRRSRRPLPTAGCPLPVYEAEGLSSPCLCGVLRPAVYLTPEAAADGTVRTHVLAHELTHFRHRDHIWSLLRCLALALHWYNPLVWAAVVLSKRDGELSCDEGTIRRLGEGERISYGRTLIGLVARRSGAGGALSCSTTMTGGKKTVQRRITQLVKQPETKKTALFLAAAALALAAVFVFAGQSDQQAAWRRFQNAAASAAAICYGPPTFSSQFWPADITDADLLEEARSLLLDAQPASRSPDADWNQAVLHASSLILMPELNEAYDYFLVPFQGDTYILTPAQWDAEAYTPVAVLEDQNVISALEDLTRTQYERNQEQTESESGFSPEGLTFSSSGGSFDQVAQDFGAALAQAYLDLSTDDPKAVVFAQTGSWEITQTLPEDGDRFCVRLSLVVQPLAPNTVYWMAGAGLDLTEDGRWLDTHEYRLERVEGDTWICAEYGGSINLPGEDTTVQNAGAQTSDSETWTDGLSFSGLAPGGEAVRSEAVQIPEGGADFIYTITYARPSLTLEAGLRGIDGTEYHQRVEDGDAHGTLEDIPAGIYTLFVRNVGDYTHFPSYQDGSGDYAATGAINFYFGTDTNSPAE
ncbi:M56 family metallopeptidase [Pseudoflavonifractor sp. An184]|uniref:M56 family metallopeptidase n=1 Tax=Pseudoflavonifractor sp. An184 TaxID=1965576 RepID=UPI000B396CD3|nr:M56 family metallopeptidase [Pseudoflavonifractor sp. An184]OUP53043.1 hypothetical protein B5F19_12790 [Pseudoflavonifractor sp. An184]